MTTELTTRGQADAAMMEKVLVGGDLSALTPAERMNYYKEVCNSLGLNPLTRPFAYIVLNDKLTLYALRDTTDQLRKIHSINVQIVDRATVEGVYIVTARATDGTGRSDESIGAVPLIKADGEWGTAPSGKRYFKPNGGTSPLSPDERANAIMKAETKAKRRVTLSLVGLGWLDESELETIKDARPVTVSEAEETLSEPIKPGSTVQPAPKATPAKKGVLLPPTDEEVRDLSHFLKWAYDGGLKLADICNLLGVPNQLAIKDKYGDFRKAADALMANVPQGATE